MTIEASSIPLIFLCCAAQIAIEISTICFDSDTFFFGGDMVNWWLSKLPTDQLIESDAHVHIDIGLSRAEMDANYVPNAHRAYYFFFLFQKTMLICFVRGNGKRLVCVFVCFSHPLT